MIAKSSKVVTWDRKVVCLLNSYMELFNSKECCPFHKRKKNNLASFGTVGKLHLESDWSATEVAAEIRSTFSEVMKV